MKKLCATLIVVFSILLSPIVSTSFDALAGRTNQGYGGGYCDCQTAPPGTCWEDDALTIPCNTQAGEDPGGGGGDVPPGGGNNFASPGSQSDGELPMLFIAAIALYVALRQSRY